MMLNRLVAAIAMASAVMSVAGQDDCGTMCSVGLHETGKYSVVSPVGRQQVEPMSPAPRLSTLEGKTIALVGGSFMASVTHSELKRLIQAEFPTSKVYLLSEIGSAGLYPAPGVRRESVETFKQRLRQHGVDAVVSGNGGCGICTPRETGSCIAAESMGIPAVMIAAPGFDAQAVATARHAGLPTLRVAVYPGAFASHSEAVLKENTRAVLWPSVKKALTEAFTAEELGGGDALADDPRATVYEGSVDEVNSYFGEMKWSDGLPIVPPTVERVKEFLRFTPYAWDREVATLSPSMRTALTWHVAVNGVMAGCKPEHMPLLVALVKAMENPMFRRTLASTHAWSPYCWVNGPVARQLGVDCGQGEISEPVNAALGRFLNLAMLNLAGYYVKQDRMGTFGYLMPWCLAEDEAACRSVGWQPFHVRQGYALNDNTVTVASALQWGNNMAPATTDGRRIADLLAWDIAQRSQLALGSGMQYTFRTVLMTPEVARLLSESYGTPGNLENHLVAYSRRPLKERAYANYYANPGSHMRSSLEQYTGVLETEEQAQMTRTPEWYDTNKDKIMTVPTMLKGETAFLVTGDASRNKIQTMPGGGMGTVKVELPDNWDELMAEKGYAPLSDMYLSTDSEAFKSQGVKAENAPISTDYKRMSDHRKHNRSGDYRQRRGPGGERRIGEGDRYPVEFMNQGRRGF